MTAKRRITSYLKLILPGLAIFLMLSCSDSGLSEAEPRLLSGIYTTEGECLTSFQFNEDRQVDEFTHHIKVWDEEGSYLYQMIHLVYYYEMGQLYRINDFNNRDVFIGYESFEYNKDGTVDNAQRFNPSSIYEEQTDYYYDSLGKIRRIVSGRYGTPHRYSDFEYDMDNVSRRISFGDGYRDSVITEFEYDDGINPYYHLNLLYTPLFSGFILPSQFMSANNMTRYTRMWKQYPDETVLFQYSYDENGYPLNRYGQWQDTVFFEYLSQ